MSQLFTSGGQSIGVSASTSVFPMNIQDWFPLEWTGWIFFAVQEISLYTTSKQQAVWLHVANHYIDGYYMYQQ